MRTDQLKVLVVTVVHTPLDARIFRRQIGTLIDAGAQVTYGAPWSATGTALPETAGLIPLDLPRASGRRRLAAISSARRCLRRFGPAADIIILHDPELVLAVSGQRRHLPPIVLDIHEDMAASLIDRSWLPPPLRSAAAAAVRIAERWAERNLSLMLAERSYQRRFSLTHPFVPNVPPRPKYEPPPPGDRSVVYLGRIARSRGALEILAMAEELKGEFNIRLIGAADDDVRGLIEEAVSRGLVRWDGFIPNDRALDIIAGSLAGLSLLHDQPNFSLSLPTKVLEYASRRVPVISSDLPVPGPFIRAERIGIVVPAGDPAAAAAAVRRLRDDADERRAMADRGFALVSSELNWDRAGTEFVARLRFLAGQGKAG